MNSFLRNLISRAHAQADPVRPRLPAMFERPTPAAATLDERSVEIPATPSPFEPATQEPHEHPARALAGRMAPETPHPAGLAFPPATPGLRRSTPGEPPPASPQRFFGPQDAFGPRHAPVTSAHVERGIEPTVTSSRVHPTEAPTAADSSEAASLSRGLHASTVQPKIVSPASIPKLPQADPPQRAELAQTRPIQTRRAPDRQLLRQTPRPEPETTTVHVNIGRIEVRAAHEPPERPRSERTAPVMTLDDYLKSRHRS